MSCTAQPVPGSRDRFEAFPKSDVHHYSAPNAMSEMSRSAALRRIAFADGSGHLTVELGLQRPSYTAVPVMPSAADVDHAYSPNSFLSECFRDCGSARGTLLRPRGSRCVRDKCYFDVPYSAGCASHFVCCGLQTSRDRNFLLFTGAYTAKLSLSVNDVYSKNPRTRFFLMIFIHL